MYFNPRSRMGATVSFAPSVVYVPFQSTLPYGSDFITAGTPRPFSYFNPRSRMGATAAVDIIFRDADDSSRCPWVLRCRTDTTGEQTNAHLKNCPLCGWRAMGTLVRVPGCVCAWCESPQTVMSACGSRCGAWKLCQEQPPENAEKK